MIFRLIYHRELAQASYLIGCSETGEALIVDPNRDIEQYCDVARQEGLRIAAVTETHIHADFVSGARELAQRTGAELLLSDAGPPAWKYAYAHEAGARLLRDGDTFTIGRIRIDVLHVPGHTPEHLAFLVTDTAVADQPMGVCTGDCVFVGDVGRPDLLEKAVGESGASTAAARQLYESLQRIRALPPYVQIWPGHGAGSACGRALGAVPQSTVGYESRFNWAFNVHDVDQFVERVLQDQPEPPPYFAQMKRINRDGSASTVSRVLSVSKPGGVELHDALESEALLVDTRAPEAFAAGHIPGTINLPLNGAFLNWAGWLLPYDRPLIMIVDDSQAEHVAQSLRLIGLEQQARLWSSAVLDSYAGNGASFVTQQRLEIDDLQRMMTQDDTFILDVRKPDEYARGHIKGSRNVPLNELQRRMHEVPKDRPIVVHCQGGTRSAIAVSLLTMHGYTNVFDVPDGFGAWEQGGRAVERRAFAAAH